MSISLSPVYDAARNKCSMLTAASCRRIIAELARVARQLGIDILQRDITRYARQLAIAASSSSAIATLKLTEMK